jgi:hypothetical protein
VVDDGLKLDSGGTELLGLNLGRNLSVMDIMQDVDLANHVPKRRSLRETEDVPTTVLGLSWSVWLRQMLSDYDCQWFDRKDWRCSRWKCRVCVDAAVR